MVPLLEDGPDAPGARFIRHQPAARVAQVVRHVLHLPVTGHSFRRRAPVTVYQRQRIVVLVIDNDSLPLFFIRNGHHVVISVIGKYRAARQAVQAVVKVSFLLAQRVVLCISPPNFLSHLKLRSTISYGKFRIMTEIN